MFGALGVGAVLNSKTALLKRQPDAAPEIIAVLAKVYADVGKRAKSRAAGPAGTEPAAKRARVGGVDGEGAAPPALVTLAKVTVAAKGKIDISFAK